MKPIQANVQHVEVKEEDDKDVVDLAAPSRGKATTALNDAFDKLTALAREMFQNMKLAAKGEPVPPLKSLIVKTEVASGSSETATSANIKMGANEPVMEGDAAVEGEDDDISVKSEDGDQHCPCVVVGSEDEDEAEEENNLPDL